MAKVTLQVPKIIGQGTGQFFLEEDINLNPPLFKIVGEIDKWIDVYHTKVTPGKVIFNAWVWKNIIYKTVTSITDPTHLLQTTGPLQHVTTRAALANFIKIIPTNPGEVFLETDTAEVIVAQTYVEGEKDDLLLPTEVEGENDDLLLPTEVSGTGCTVTVYEKIHEKMIIKITVKVTRMSHITVEEDC